ncbi:MAG: efflux RND transporter periplasmic adaptor subunit [Methyloligellaceae bacterium]
MLQDQKETKNTASYKNTKKQIIGIAGVGLLFIGSIVAGVHILKEHAAAEKKLDPNPPVSVNHKTIKTVDGYMITEFYAGRVEAERETQLAFERSGLVVKVMANEGDNIKRGTVVASLDISQLENRKAQLEAQKDELQAQLNLAKATLERRSSLQKKGWSPTQSYDEARFSVEQLSASLQRISASIRSVSIDLEKSQLKAPFSGTIAARSIDEGAVVNAGTPVMTLLDARQGQIRVGVSVTAAKKLVSGKGYTFRINGRDFIGHMVSKRPDLQSGTRTVTILFEFKDNDSVPLGEIAELVLSRKVSEPGVWLPLAALNEGQKGLWTVFTAVQENNRYVAKREAVEVLYSSGERVFVRGTVKNGDIVVTNGVNRITPNQIIQLASQGK